jgi:hypothetical protein
MIPPKLTLAITVFAVALATSRSVSVVPELSLTRTGDVTDAGVVVHAHVIY